MEKKNIRIIQIIVFAFLAIAQFGLSLNYMIKGDMVGGIIFLVTAIALAIGAVGYFVARKHGN